MSSKFHRDWRDWIAKKIRAKHRRERKREPASPYLMRSLDKFERLVPHLRVRTETVMQFEALCKIVNRPGESETWTGNSASRFLRYLQEIGVLQIRYAGKAGNGYKLLKNLAVPPARSRQSGGGHISCGSGTQTAGDKQQEAQSTIPTEVEFDPMPAPAPPPAAPEETVELDGGAVLSAIDHITERLGAVNLSFRTQLSGDAAARVYDVQTIVSDAMRDLSRLRSAILRGDGAPLQQILED